MKYMGSKRAMLSNGLGDLLLREAGRSSRFVDLFSGSAIVSTYIAQRASVPVLAIDLQSYSSALANAILLRTGPTDFATINDDWLAAATRSLSVSKRWKSCRQIQIGSTNDVLDARTRCLETSRVGPIWNAYGGHYYSPAQALAFDYMLKNLPNDRPRRALALAACVVSASRCAAAPGHTAQPFAATESALPSIRAAWSRDPVQIAGEVLRDLCATYSLVQGDARIGDAVSEVEHLKNTDFVFLDPPYSAAQYSRFYHVLETIAVGHTAPVSGRGRYPDISLRPTSDFSLKSASLGAMTALLEGLANVGCRAAMTFPQHTSSNGLSGMQIVSLAKHNFRVDVKPVVSHFSTLGGNGVSRAARRRSTELILLLQPR